MGNAFLLLLDDPGFLLFAINIALPGEQNLGMLGKAALNETDSADY